MANEDNRISVNLRIYGFDNLRFINLNQDEINVKSNIGFPKPGMVMSAKVVIRINEDFTWTAFRGDLTEPADACIMHGLLLDEITAKTLFRIFSRQYPHPYSFKNHIYTKPDKPL